MSEPTNIAVETGPSPLVTRGVVLRRFLIALLFGAVLLVCRWFAYQIRFDFDVPEQCAVQFRQNWHWITLVQLLCLAICGQFSGIYRYFSLPDLKRLAYAMILMGATLLSIGTWGNLAYSPPRSVILLNCLFSFVVIGGMRVGWRLVHERYLTRKKGKCAPERAVAIVGAGDAASNIICELNAHPELGMIPVVIFDDAPEKHGSRLHEIPVIGPPELLGRALAKYDFKEVIIAMPSASAERLGQVVELLHKAKLKYVTLPSIGQLATGKVSVSQLRPVNIEDLLGREQVDLRPDEISGVLKGRVVMVTGAGGSIGSELCRQVASFGPAKLLLIEQSEVQLFQVEQELIGLGHKEIIYPLIADILDRARIDSILSRFKPAVIFHAAAHKHVLMMEIQPAEAIKNNALGTAGLAEAALQHCVERFVMISTDKAVNPTSVMGATKRLAEVFLQAFARQNPGKTRFTAVRFGNVLGSSGSVVPIFERQIAQGGPVTVTDPNVVRYFMTIPEAVGLVLQSCALGGSGEILVLDMGKPVKIADLANQMIRLSGLEPGRDIQITYTGLKPGEKLFEELQHLHANCSGTAHPRIKCLTSDSKPLEAVRAHFSKFNGDLNSKSPDELRRIIKSILPEYTPYVPGVPAPAAKVNGASAALPVGVGKDGNGKPDESIPRLGHGDIATVSVGEDHRRTSGISPLRA